MPFPLEDEIAMDLTRAEALAETENDFEEALRIAMDCFDRIRSAWGETSEFSAVQNGVVARFVISLNSRWRTVSPETFGHVHRQIRQERVRGHAAEYSLPLLLSADPGDPGTALCSPAKESALPVVATRALALGDFERALELLNDGDEPESGSDEAAVHLVEALNWLWSTQDPEGHSQAILSLLRDRVEAARQSGDPLLVCTRELALVPWMRQNNQQQEARDLIEQCLETAGQANDKELMARVHGTAARFLWREGQLDEAGAHLTRALQLAEAAEAEGLESLVRADIENLQARRDNPHWPFVVD